ncbi:hypothetical protein FOMPIDRAFT_1051349 [Fomitopsis schrenkii]|uniref:THIF-type NAD/FAD binding fold domain-containing protein n=1 Tax=Fomitopsis schrenkii TaxID=2126942 RepID=S8FAU6_FOMSC|nr:hypothetical protein FOMPIDRAFT_1051349 [Fomitopsis schrenkii]
MTKDGTLISVNPANMDDGERTPTNLRLTVGALPPFYVIARHRHRPPASPPPPATAITTPRLVAHFPPSDVIARRPHSPCRPCLPYVRFSASRYHRLTAPPTTARTLMGWGVRTITIVDSSRVSFSNPVRELLFELNGRKPKAACAAELLKRFFLRVNATKRSLSVPIPYRPISRASVAQANADVAALEALFDTLDAIFLLMESCESRWLLTAPGFDMFHGELLSDIVAPADALQLFSTDPTVERMYTVTRSGLAATAFATAVEPLVSLLQHSDG